MDAKNGRLDKYTQTVGRNAESWIQTKYWVDCSALLPGSQVGFLSSGKSIHDYCWSIALAGHVKEAYEVL